MENPNGEWIALTNVSRQTINLQGYRLNDNGPHVYTFNDYSLPAGETVRLYSGAGADGAGELYWGNVGASVWNNEGDVAYLYSANGTLVSQYQY